MAVTSVQPKEKGNNIMCGKSLVEQTALNSTTDGKGELPVENVGDGEGTVIMGYSNPHLSVRKAMGCPIARCYFVKAFDALSATDKEGFIAATHLYDFAILTAFVVNDLQGLALLAYAKADALHLMCIM
jgi:hypothetical protein